MGLFAPALPPQSGRSPSKAIEATADTWLGRQVADRRSGHGDLSGVHLLRDGKDAFASRVVLARKAERALDVQYYIWHDDLSGALMVDALRQAAERGVRVRLLLDDNGIGGLDPVLAELDGHSQVEVRLFNPMAIRAPKSVNWALDFRRLNHRMHAKSFTADGQVTIVGGRNVGDEYFGAREGGLFMDLDALCLGPVVDEVASEFDRHWHSRHAYPAARILPPLSDDQAAKARDHIATCVTGPEADHYRKAVEALPLFDEMADGDVPFDWAPVQLIADDPDRLLDPVDPAAVMADDVVRLLAEAREELTLVSGYFVPTPTLADVLEERARAGVRVRVLTNSYAATDVGAVHAGYAPQRHRLLAAGVRLFEMPAPDDKPKSSGKFVRPGGRGGQLPGTTLHAKAFVVDRTRVLVGSFNLDPRSAALNTELGVVIDSPAAAGEMARLFDEEVEPCVYRLELTERGIVWVDERDDDPQPERVEPGTKPWSRALLWILGRLPIRWLL